MAKVSYPTEARIPLPLLVTEDQLKRLDQILDQSHVKLRLERDRQLEADIDEDIADDLRRERIKKQEITSEYREKLKKQSLLRSSWREEERAVTISLTRGRQVTVESFAEAESQAISQDEVPLGFVCRLNVGPAGLHVSLNGRWSEDLRIEVKPNHGEAAQEVFGALVNWANDVRAPKWQRRWHQLQFASVMLLALIVLLGMILFPLITWGQGVQESNREEARKLLAQGGINPANEARALELILAIESDFEPAGSQRRLPGTRYWAYISLAGAFLLIVAIRPTRAIGLWKGKEKLKREKLWIRIVSVTIPTLLVTTVLLPWLLHFLHLRPPSP
jgi:hypothetical protein